MIVTADEVTRSLRGTAALINRPQEALKAFDCSESGFWHSFGAIVLTLPAYVVALAAERHRLGLALPGRSLVDDGVLAGLTALAHVAAFLALPVAMIFVARSLGLSKRYVPFVIVTNWVSVVAATVLSVPLILSLIGWATPGLAILFSLGFGIIVLKLQWCAAKISLEVSNGLAVAIVGLGLTLNLGTWAALRAVGA
jgi:hypothetical protein